MNKFLDTKVLVTIILAGLILALVTPKVLEATKKSDFDNRSEGFED